MHLNVNELHILEHMYESKKIVRHIEFDHNSTLYATLSKGMDTRVFSMR